MFYPKAKRYNKQTIETKNFVAYCATYNRRDGFAHEVTIYTGDGRFSAEGVQNWCNRTWESYEYESALKRAINKLPEEVRDAARAEFQAAADKESARLDAMFNGFKAAFESLTPGARDAIASAAGYVNTKAQFESVCAVTEALSLLNNIK